MKFNSLIPELSVSNIQISKEFYLSLGFVIIYERTDVEKLYNHISMLNISIFKKLETHTYLVNGIEYMIKNF